VLFEALTSTEAQLKLWAESIALASKHVSAEAIETIFRHQHHLIFKDKFAVGEITMTSSDAVASEFWFLLPFSRGAVHLDARNDDGTYKVNIDPRFLTSDFDETSFISLFKLTQNL